MSKKKINLEEILINSFNGKYWDIPFEPTKKAMKEAIKQALELAAENAKVVERMGRDANHECFVNQQSILDTIKQVE